MSALPSASSGYGRYARAAVYFFDRSLTLADELDFVWRRRASMSVASMLYLLMHASMSLYMALLATGAWIDVGCKVGLGKSPHLIVLSSLRIS